MPNNTLFQLGHFVLASGADANWKIECDALTASDWQGLAKIAYELLPPFGSVAGVPTGGIPFADCLRFYAKPGYPLLIAEDVVTTGQSMENIRNGRWAIGVCVFARHKLPPWIMPIFQMPLKEWTAVKTIG